MFNEHWANKDQFPTDIDEELEKKIPQNDELSYRTSFYWSIVMSIVINTMNKLL